MRAVEKDPVLVDTSAWIEFFNRSGSGVARRLEAAMMDERVIVGDLILVEVLQGVRHDAQRRDIARVMDRFRLEPLCGRAIALGAADNYRAMRRQGLTIRGTIDVIIATWCIAEKVPLLHNDRDFSTMETALGLRILATNIIT